MSVCLSVLTVTLGGCLNRGKTIELLYGRLKGGVDGPLLET